MLPVLGELSRLPQYSNWKFHFSGAPTWEVDQAIRKDALEVSPAFGPTMFPPMFALFAPWVHVVPLADSRFNRAKSMIAWIEATCAGAVVLAPDWEEWQRPGVVHYRDAEEFCNKLKVLMHQFGKTEDTKGRDPERGEVHPHAGISRYYIENHLMLDTVNERRWAILNTLAGLGRFVG